MNCSRSLDSKISNQLRFGCNYVHTQAQIDKYSNTFFINIVDDDRDEYEKPIAGQRGICVGVYHYDGTTPKTFPQLLRKERITDKRYLRNSIVFPFPLFFVPDKHFFVWDFQIQWRVSRAKHCSYMQEQIEYVTLQLAKYKSRPNKYKFSA